ncbi:patatin-like phospholipase family protein [Poritiphilus flavus]|uniref:Patatin-like phospholipase family protein n=1 Tax=Poritiphilus flavus TaxID=2697053 RepID=A0A6L9EEM2_9FLAO|nr:patatin-like phospholipase family protein [Poritiphilus flavus]NAS13103.1 patatin-like phospholipase family protein [Poritiphilus flavus]
MRAMVISGGGSKGAFAGGVAQYLMQALGHSYDLFLGTSTGSLLISHLALQKIQKIKDVYCSVDQDSIFSNCPFTIQKRYGMANIAINHWNVLRNFYSGSKTFGESHNLLKLIRETLTIEEFESLKNGPKDIVVTVSNLSLNQVEYKSINDFEYDDFCEWIWISCNYTPFMSLIRKNGCEYADGGLGSMVPIEEAVKRGAKVVDAIILHTEVTHFNRMPSKNVFSLLTSMFAFMLDRIEQQNIRIGKYVANHNDAIINFYYTPIVLTTNSLIFDKEKMTSWWERGYEFAETKNTETSEIEPEN